MGIKKSSWDKNLQRGKLMDIFMTVEALHSGTSFPFVAAVHNLPKKKCIIIQDNAAADYLLCKGTRVKQ